LSDRFEFANYLTSFDDEIDVFCYNDYLKVELYKNKDCLNVNTKVEGIQNVSCIEVCGDSYISNISVFTNKHVSLNDADPSLSEIHTNIFAFKADSVVSTRLNSLAMLKYIDVKDQSQLQKFFQSIPDVQPVDIVLIFDALRTNCLSKYVINTILPI
jgi:hypothetical protein